MVAVSKSNKNKGGNLRSYFLYKKASAGKDRFADAVKKLPCDFTRGSFLLLNYFIFCA